MTPQAALDTINGACPDWLRLYKIVPVGPGHWCAQFRLMWGDTDDLHLQSVTFDTLEGLLASVMETLPTLRRDAMNIFGTDLFKYISADMLAGKDVTKEIETVKAETLTNERGSEEKPVVYFKGSNKGWVLNKTAARSLAKVLGPETNDWKGATVVLYAADITAFGKQLKTIRVRDVVPVKSGK
jgi:hypothetical protein